MYYDDQALFPENMQPLIITAAPYGPTWLPGDVDNMPISWDEQVQAAVDCYNAGATILHFHVRDPETGHLSADIDHYNYLLGRVKEAVPEMIMQVGGSIAFSPKSDGAKAEWLDYDTRHMLAELDPKPETVTIAIGTSMFDITQMWNEDDIKGTHLEDPKVIAAYAGMFTDAGPAFYLEHLKRLRAAGIQPFFTLAHVHQLEIVERLIRSGAYMGPLNTNITTYGGGGCGYNPFDWMNWLQREPQGATVHFWSTMRISAVAQPMAIVLGHHVRVGIEDNLWNSRRGAHVDRGSDRGRGGALRAVRPQDCDREGGPRDPEDRCLVRQHRRDASEPRDASQPRWSGEGLHRLRDRRQEAGRSTGG